MKVQPFTVGIGHGNAQVAATNACHEVDHVHIDMLSRADEVSFVFATFIINEDDHATLFQVFQDLRNRAQHSPAIVT